MRFHIDCRASANILPSKYVEDVDLESCSQSLVRWNGTKVKPIVYRVPMPVLSGRSLLNGISLSPKSFTAYIIINLLVQP